MGSNKVDFMHSPVKDHGIETLLYTPLVTSENRHEFLHDYRRNDARAQGKCSLGASKLEVSAEDTKRAGILEVLEVEETAVALDESLVVVLEKVVQREGFTRTSDSVYVPRQSVLQYGHQLVGQFSQA